MLGLKQLGKKKHPAAECKPCPKQFQGIPEGGSIPDCKVPTFTHNPKTGQRTVSYRGVTQNVATIQYAEILHVPECVYVETKYYWIKDIKDGKTYMASERIEKQDGKLISCWAVKDGPHCTSSTGFSREGILNYYEIIEEVCPPTTQW
jgi:hypothetical protein